MSLNTNRHVDRQKFSFDSPQRKSDAETHHPRLRLLLLSLIVITRVCSKVKRGEGDNFKLYYYTRKGGAT
jgi:hypothetical protein